MKERIIKIICILGIITGAVYLQISPFFDWIMLVGGLVTLVSFTALYAVVEWLRSLPTEKDIKELRKALSDAHGEVERLKALGKIDKRTEFDMLRSARGLVKE